jgi:hypothetical protein
MRVLRILKRPRCGENKDLNMRRESVMGAGGCWVCEEVKAVDILRGEHIRWDRMVAVVWRVKRAYRNIGVL